MKIAKPSPSSLETITRRLRKQKDFLKDQFASELRFAFVLLLPWNFADSASVALVEALHRQLDTVFDVTTNQVSLKTLGIQASDLPVESLVACFRVKYATEERLKQELAAFFLKQSGKPRHLRTRQGSPMSYVLLARSNQIKCHSFAHGHGHYYRYRLALDRIGDLPPSLRTLLMSLPTNTPNDYFFKGPRASHTILNVVVPIVQTNQHSVISLAQKALRNRRFKSAHEDVEKFSIENDIQTLATEVPVWLEPSEMSEFGMLSTPDETLTGHIDILRLEEDLKIGIWDYKPSASEETNAHAQVFLYALMLSKRVGLPLNRFRCGYFDSVSAYIFSPSEVEPCARIRGVFA